VTMGRKDGKVLDRFQEGPSDSTHSGIGRKEAVRMDYRLRHASMLSDASLFVNRLPPRIHDSNHHLPHCTAPSRL
jgi:hypothetical protein